MSDSLLHWPPSLALTAVGALLLVATTSAVGLFVARRRNRTVTQLSAQFAEHGVTASSAYSVGDGKTRLIVADDRLIVADLQDSRIVQLTDVADASGIRIYEKATDTMAFRIFADSGAQSRKLTTRSVVGFARIFAHLAGSGKSIDYIQE